MKFTFFKHLALFANVQILRSDPFLAGRENRSRNLCDVYSYVLLLPLAIVFTRLLFSFYLNYYFASFVMAFSQIPSVTIVGFLAETRISDVIVRPEVKIVAGKTSQKESWAPKVHSTSVCCGAH